LLYTASYSLAIWAYRFSGRRPNRPPLALLFLCLCLFFVFAGGVLFHLLPALSLSPCDTPTPPNDEANLKRCACVFCDVWETADKREGSGRAACTPASQPPSQIVARPKQQFPTTPNNHGDMTSRWPFPWARHAVPALLAFAFDHVRGTRAARPCR